MEGGTDLRAARLAIVTVGRVINVSTRPATTGAERGKPKKLIKIARPKRPNTMDGTAARLLMFTSMMSIQRLFLGAYSSKNTAVATPRMNERKRVIERV